MDDFEEKKDMYDEFNDLDQQFDFQVCNLQVEFSIKCYLSRTLFDIDIIK